MAYILPKTGEIIAFDVTISDTHESTVEITSHPVEAGADITDHVRPLPDNLALDVYVTNTPVEISPGQGPALSPYMGAYQNTLLAIPQWDPPIEPTPGSLFRLAAKGLNAVKDLITGGKPPTKATLLFFPAVFDRIKEIHETLTRVMRAGTLCRVVTDTKNYDDMVITRVGLPRTERGGADIAIDLVSIRQVTTATVTAPKPLEPRGAPGQSKGAQGAKPTKSADAVKAASLAAKALEAVSDTLGL